MLKSKTRTYVSWSNMKTRCLNPNFRGYRMYGGRGITICDRWIDSFDNFLSDMGERPENKSLDRIEGKGNYEPGNCRWATSKEQARNTSRVWFVEIDGQKRLLSDIATEHGFCSNLLLRRAKQRGLDAETVLKEFMENPTLLKNRTVARGTWSQKGDDTPYIGKTYAFLTVIRRTGVNRIGRLFLCKCVCGYEIEAQLGYLVKGDRTSCGCKNREGSSQRRREYNERRRMEKANA